MFSIEITSMQFAFGDKREVYQLGKTVTKKKEGEKGKEASALG